MCKAEESAAGVVAGYKPSRTLDDNSQLYYSEALFCIPYSLLCFYFFMSYAYHLYSLLHPHLRKGEVPHVLLDKLAAYRVHTKIPERNESSNCDIATAGEDY